MRQATGVITVIQEGRFRLDGGDGRSLHFTLHRNSRVEPQDLPRLKGVPVVVDYRPAPGVQGQLAYSIRRIAS